MELLVVLVLLGILAGVSAGSLTSLREPSADAQTKAVRRARVQAVQRGTSVLLQADSTWTRFLPDGRVLRGDSRVADTSMAED